MRYTYTVTKKCCPVCGTVLGSDNPVGWYVLGFFLFPLIGYVVLFLLARWVLKNFILCVDVPSVCKRAHVRCPKCGTIVRINNNPTYDELDDEDKLQYDKRGLFRMAYFSGGMLILSIAFSFFLTASDSTCKTIGTVFLCFVFVWLIIILVIVFYWKSKRKSLENISKATSAKEQSKTKGVPQSPNAERQNKIYEEERLRAIAKSEEIKKAIEARKRREAEQAQKQKAEQDAATCKMLLDACGMQFFIEYYPQLKRLPIPDITVSDHYFPERQVRLTAAKKIIDLGQSEYALHYIIEKYGDVFPNEVIERAKSILEEIENNQKEKQSENNQSGRSDLR